MSLPHDTASVISSVAQMSEMEYVYLLFKLGGVLVGVLVGFLGVIVALVRSGRVAWDFILAHISGSLRGTFCTAQQMEECKVEQAEELRQAISNLENLIRNGFSAVQSRLALGDQRMDATQKDVRRQGRRIDQLFEALAGVNSETGEALESNETMTIPVIDRPIFPLPEDASRD